MKAAKSRLDVLLVARGLAPSRERAQALILSGNVLVNDEPATKAGQSFVDDVVIRVRGEDHPYVSRGGVKLNQALTEFQVDPRGKKALDVGASTGGFTHCLLLNGASEVWAIDVGHDQMAWGIRSDPRVRVFEGLNARTVTRKDLGTEYLPVDLVVMDLSFISLKLVLENLLPLSSPNADWIALIKPQFEVGREKVGKGGIVRSESDQKDAVDAVNQKAESLGLKLKGLIHSPILGTNGNREFLAHWRIESCSPRATREPSSRS